MSGAPLSEMAIYLHPEDNVAVASRHLPEGLELEHCGHTLILNRRIPLGHKVAVRDIARGKEIRKYGQIIGFAAETIPAGSHVHVHNVSAAAFERDYAFCREC